MTSPGVGSTTHRLGRYHLAEPLGGGPTGEVFRAKVYGVAGFERQFAVKRFHAEFVKDPTTAAAISAAARTYGSLEHPRIARLHEYGVTGGETFTATELIQGLDLARLVNVCGSMGKRFPLGAMATLIAQAARTIGYAHGRGICHLGLCPTNLIVTPEGEVKITDFGFLPARLPEDPGEDNSLRARMPYVAPEQIAGEPTSAATDVFQLGVVAHELFTGRQAFTGPTSRDIAQKVLAANPPSHDLPRPLAKVLQRCMARSPFERYPDARALADALDAATRGARLPGGVHDIGAAVREATAYVSSLHSEQVSGAVSFPLPAPPPSGKTKMPEAEADKPARSTKIMGSLTPSGAPAQPPRPPPPREPIAEASERAQSQPTLIAEPLGMTIRGGAGDNMRPIRMPALDDAVEELDGPVEELDEEIPTRIRERNRGFVSVPDKSKPGPSMARDLATSGDSSVDVVDADDIHPVVPTRPGTPPPIPVNHRTQTPAVEQSPDRPLRAATPPPLPPPGPGTKPTADASPAAIVPAPPPERVRPARLPETLDDSSSPLGGPTDLVADSASPPGGPWAEPAGRQMPPRAEALPGGFAPPGQMADAAKKPGKKSTAKWLALILGLAVIGGGGYFAYDRFVAGKDATEPEASGRDALAGVAADSGAAGPVTDAGPAPAAADGGAAKIAIDAAVAKSEPDAGPAMPSFGAPIKVTPGPEGKLSIRSKPRRARVYLDGSLQGKTPVTLDATTDSHRLALVKEGYKLYAGDIQGKGTIEITLEEASSPEGPAGIKVRCRKKNRYYVFVDGIPTGQLCPTERLGVDVGLHQVEIYDPLNDSRREFPANVTGTKRSLRVRVD